MRLVRTRLGRAEGLFVLALGGATWAVYAATRHPGLAGISTPTVPNAVPIASSTPLLQSGALTHEVVAASGSPLYAVVAHLAAPILFSAPARGLNLLAGLWASATMLLVWLSLRRLGCRRVPAMLTALGAAFGRTWWSQATVANAHVVTGALVAGLILALLRWGASRRNSTWYSMLVLGALGIASWPGCVSLLPAAAVYVALTDRTIVRRVRPMAAVAVLLGGALAASLGWLDAIGGLTTVTAVMPILHRVAGPFMAVDLPAVANVARAVFLEFWASGIVFAGIGLVALCRTRLAEAVLVTGGSVGLAVAGIAAGAAEQPALLLPAFVLLWLLIGPGLEWVVSWLGVRYGRPVVVGCACLLPLVQLFGNYLVEDRSAEMFETRYVDALFAAAPHPSAIVRESPALDAVVRYMQAAMPGSPGRRLRLIDRNPATIRRYLIGGYRVFAFGQSRRDLEPWNVRFEPVPLLDSALPEYLSRLPAGSIVAMAGRTDWIEALPEAATRALAALGAAPPGATDPAYGLVGVRGAQGTFRVSGHRFDVRLRAGQRIGSSPVRTPVDIRLVTRGARGEVWLGDRMAAEVSGGVALVVVSPDGSMARGAITSAVSDYRLPFNAPRLALSRVTAVGTCVPLPGGAWTDVTMTTTSTGQVALHRAPVDRNGTLVLYLGRDRTLRPRAFTAGGERIPFDLQTFSTATVDALAERLGRDHVDANDSLTHAAFVYRLEFQRGTPPVIILKLRGLPERALMRSTLWVPPALCSMPIADGLFLERAIEVVTSGSHPDMFGGGWYPAEDATEGSFRWTSAPESELLVPLARAGQVRVRIDVRQVARPDAPNGTIALQVNGVKSAARRLKAGPATYEWIVPAVAWRRGLNVVLLRAPIARSPAELGVGDDARRLGVAVAGWTFERLSPPRP